MPRRLRQRADGPDRQGLLRGPDASRSLGAHPRRARGRGACRSPGSQIGRFASEPAGGVTTLAAVRSRGATPHNASVELALARGRHGEADRRHRGAAGPRPGSASPAACAGGAPARGPLCPPIPARACPPTRPATHGPRGARLDLAAKPLRPPPTSDGGDPPAALARAGRRQSSRPAGAVLGGRARPSPARARRPSWPSRRPPRWAGRGTAGADDLTVIDGNLRPKLEGAAGRAGLLALRPDRRLGTRRGGRGQLPPRQLPGPGRARRLDRAGPRPFRARL